MRRNSCGGGGDGDVVVVVVVVVVLVGVVVSVVVIGKVGVGGGQVRENSHRSNLDNGLIKISHMEI